MLIHKSHKLVFFLVNYFCGLAIICKTGVIKCKIVSFTRNIKPIVFNYHLNGTILENVSCHN